MELFSIRIQRTFQLVSTIQGLMQVFLLLYNDISSYYMNLFILLSVDNENNP